MARSASETEAETDEDLNGTMGAFDVDTLASMLHAGAGMPRASRASRRRFKS